MFDLNKIKRFEKSLEIHNQSAKVAEFWNEIADDLLYFDEAINEIQTENYLLFKKFGEFQNKINFLQLQNKILNSLTMANNFLFTLKKIKSNSIPKNVNKPSK